MKPATYLKRLFTGFFLMLSAGFVYAVWFNLHYPLPLSDHISLDAKVRFVRETIDPDQIDTIILGSSIGLNNVLGTVLEKKSKVIHHALNLSVYGATATQVYQLMELTKAFPNLKRIIYSAQYSDFPHPWKLKNYHPDLLRRYMRHELGPLSYAKMFFQATVNIPFLYNRQKEWVPKHQQPNKFESLLFDASGSVPLHIYGKDIISHRWRLPQPGVMHPDSFWALSQMAKLSQERGIRFYLVHQPYRKGLYDKYAKVRHAISYFDKLAQASIKRYGGILIKTQSLHLADKYFADRTHLNDSGSPKISSYIAHQIDKLESSKEKPHAK